MENTIEAAIKIMKSEATARRKKKVLIIEDDTLTRITMCKVFSKLGYEPLEACNGFFGLKQFKSQNPDLVITDLLMPDKEGLSTISEIRSLNRNVPIVAMTGGGTTHNMGFLSIAREIGANYTIGKPFRPEDILQLVKNLTQAEEAAIAK